MENKKIVSVVIPCRNEERYIEECINSILKQSYGIENIEVFVVDGCSTDNTCNIVKKYSEKCSSIKLLHNEKKVAPTAMNIGIKSAAGDIIVIFGSHAYMDKDYIVNCVKKIDNNNDIACVGGRIISISENDKSEAISLAMSSPFGVGNALFRFSDKETFVDTVAFGAYKKDIFDKIGYFDEEFVRNQDDELNFRVSESGEKILLSPDIISYYYTRGSFMKLWRQYFQYGFWKVRVIQKHKKPASIRHIIPIAFVLALLFGLILSIFSKLILTLYISMILLYLILALVSAVKVCKGKNKFVFKIVYTFIILHISYGLGFLEGLISFYLLKSSDLKEKNMKSSR